MAALNLIDRFSTTLASGYTSGATSMSITSAAGLPSGACNFWLIVQAEGANTEEVFLVTSISGTTLTVAGAQANTSASNHGAGAVVIAGIVTSAFFKQQGLLLLESHTASASTELDFTTCITSDFDEYMIEVVSLLPSTAMSFGWQMSTNGGSSYDTGSNYIWAFNYALPTSSSGGFGSTSDTAMRWPETSVTLNANTIVSGSFRLFDPLNAARYKNMTGQWVFSINSTTAPIIYNYGGIYKSTTAVDAFRLIPSTGNFTSGKVRVYGMAK